MKKKLLTAGAVTVGVLAAAGNMMYNLALRSGGNKERVFRAEENQSKRKPEAVELSEMGGYCEAWITSFDGLKLHGHVIDRGSKTFVIAMHGYNLSGKHMMNRCRGWNEQEYSLLLPDMRGHGESEGTYIGMGWHDRKDMVSWAEYINAEYEPENIILYGISMGGAAVMMAAGEKLPPNVRCIVEDCGYVSVKDEFRHEGKVVFGIPYYPLVWIGSIITKIRAGWSFEEATALQGLKETTLPMMFLHGVEDRFVPVGHALTAYGACRGEKEIFLVPDAGHGEAQDVRPEEYWSRVLEFTNRYINGDKHDKSNTI